LVALVGVTLAAFLSVGWLASILFLIGIGIAGAGGILHFREMLREDREWLETRIPAQGATAPASPKPGEVWPPASDVRWRRAEGEEHE
jgi:hypothetical protein